MSAKEITKHYPNQGMNRTGLDREAFKKVVAADEKLAVKELGGPVIRTHRFENGGLTFIWKLA